MRFKLIPSVEAAANLRSLEEDPSRKAQCNAVKKALGYMETNLRHPSLNIHKHTELSGQHGFEVFESYAQSNTPGAYRIFWRYGPQRGEITVLAIVRHPNDKRSG
jgi:hypothetical protein